MWKPRKVISKGEYNYVLLPEHPRATKNGYVLEHRVVMENHLGRLLRPNEIVHHKDGRKKHNVPSNLHVMKRGSHTRHHMLEHGLKTVVLRCPNCAKSFQRKSGNTHLASGRKTRATFCSRRCNGKFHADVRARGLTHEMKLAISANLVRVYQKVDSRKRRANLRSGDA